MITILVVALSQVQLVLSNLRIKLGKLLVNSSGVQEILAHVVAVSE